MKTLAILLLVSVLPFTMASQPGNGNANGHGNGNGSGNCGHPPCGGPHQTVPIDIQWLLYAGILFGAYLTLRFKNQTPKV